LKELRLAAQRQPDQFLRLAGVLVHAFATMHLRYFCFPYMPLFTAALRILVSTGAWMPRNFDNW
jgi:hypothetical protein